MIFSSGSYRMRCVPFIIHNNNIKYLMGIAHWICIISLLPCDLSIKTQPSCNSFIDILSEQVNPNRQNPKGDVQLLQVSNMSKLDGKSMFRTRAECCVDLFQGSYFKPTRRCNRKKMSGHHCLGLNTISFDCFGKAKSNKRLTCRFPS